jgi:hypothetical protein
VWQAAFRRSSFGGPNWGRLVNRKRKATMGYLVARTVWQVEEEFADYWRMFLLRKGEA